jgi:DNA-binding Xre family transcriptional regulator
MQTAAFSGAGNIKPAAPYFRDHEQAVRHAFDRDTGQAVNPAHLGTYAQALAQYHLSPEMKFENGDRADIGKTRRRHVHATYVTLIGKEADKWEEQFFLGLNEDAIPEYGTPGTRNAVQTAIRATFVGSDRQLAEMAGISRNTARKLKSQPEQGLRKSTISKMTRALAQQQAENQELQQLMQQTAAEIQKIGLSEFARRINCDPANLSKIMAGKRRMSTALTIRITGYFDRTPKDISDGCSITADR